MGPQVFIKIDVTFFQCQCPFCILQTGRIGCAGAGIEHAIGFVTGNPVKKFGIDT
ncbi:hypothetical protein D1872_338090 [compost metagenome]